MYDKERRNTNELQVVGQLHSTEEGGQCHRRESSCIGQYPPDKPILYAETGKTPGKCFGGESGMHTEAYRQSAL